MGVFLVIIGLLGFYFRQQNLARLLIISGAFLCLPFHFAFYKKEIAKNNKVNTI